MGKNSIQKIYSFLRGGENPIIIGLTGALGAGCSTVAKILNEKPFLEFIEDFLSLESSILYEFNCKKNIFFDTLERYRYKRLKTFYLNLKRDLQQEKSNSQKIYIKVIKVSRILEFILKKAIEEKKSNFKNELKELMNKIDNIDPRSSTDPSEIFSEIKSEIRKILKKILFGKIEELNNEIYEEKEIIPWKGDMNNTYEGKRKRLLQELGRFIKRIPIDNKIPPVFNLVKIIDQVISKDLEKEETRNSDRKIYIIDAFRNPFEIEYFKNKFNQFYLFSILADKEVRKKRLKKLGLEDKEIKDAQYIESKEPKDEDEIFEQNINFCILKGDIFINNNNDPEFKLLKYQLGKYISLILKPGLVTPTKDEMYMQLAFTAKNMSGCISRQVGAVVVGQDGYIRGVGWNDPPEKFIPCLYRTLKDLKNQGGDCCNRFIFSEYECFDEDFRKFIEKIFTNIKDQSLLDNPFCFKDLENKRKFEKDISLLEEEIKKKLKNKNISDGEKERILKILKSSIKDKLKYRDPSRERALHAEENAFLQASKIGGAPVKGGTLYTTAFPCQLCSKKIRQLFISRVVYIEDYPDISYLHTLKGGDPNAEPQVDMFTGAIGQAFFKLYSPYIPTKDELKLSNEDYHQNLYK